MDESPIGGLRVVQRMHDSALTDWIEFNSETPRVEGGNPSSQLDLYFCASCRVLMQLLLSV